MVILPVLITPVQGKARVKRIEYLSDTIAIQKDVFHYFLPFRTSISENLGVSEIPFTGDNVACAADSGAYFNDNIVSAEFAFESGSQYSVGSWFRPDRDVYVMSTCLPSMDAGTAGAQRLTARPFPEDARIALYLFTATSLILTDAIAAGRWTHIVMSTDGNCYVNGNILWTAENVVVPATVKIEMGRTSIHANEPFIGYISNAFVTRRILSEEEITILYTAGNTPI